MICNFCYVAYDMATMEQSFVWTGPYDVPVHTLEQAADILFWAMQRLVKRDANGGDFYGSRILDTVCRPPGRKCERRVDVQGAIDQVVFERTLKELYPNGVPKYRSLDG